MVYFEPMNEPYAYSDADWKNLAAQWLSNYASVAAGSVIISGAGYNQRLITIGSDSRFDGTLHLAAHLPVLQQQPHHRAAVARRPAQQRRRLRQPGAHHRVGFVHDRRPQLQRTLVHRRVRVLHPWHRRGGAGPRARHGLLAGRAHQRPVPPADRQRQRHQPHAHHHERVGSRPTALLVGPGQQRHRRRRQSRYYRVTARHSGKVMDVIGASTANNAEVKQWT